MAEIVETFEDVQVITEQASGASTLLSLSPEKVQEITEGDDDPMFATFVIEGGWSKNKRYWSDSALESISEQINSAAEPVVGYQGHIKLEDDGYSFPDIQMHWVRSVIQPSSNKVRLLAKAYLLPGTKARDYIKRKLARSVSVRGDAELAPIQGGVQVKNFTLESIDLSRPRKSGMRSELLTVSSEMEGGTVKPEEIAALQENELRAHNKSLVESIEENAKKPLEEKVTEMESAATEAQPNADALEEIRKLLKIDKDTDVLQALAAALTKMKSSAKSMREKIFDGVLEKKFKDESTRNIVKRLFVTEMESEPEDEEEPEGEEEMTKKIEEMVNQKVDQDDDLKKLVSEMENAGGRSVNGARRVFADTDEKKIEPGYEDDLIEVSKGGR